MSGYQRGHVLASLEVELGSGTLPDGTRGLFHPDGLSFGDSIAQSRIVSRAFTVTGVADVTVRRLERLFGPPPAATATSAAPIVLTVEPLEIPQLDGDPARPEGGVLRLNVSGGR
jgi:hypothetical protein